MWNYSGDPGASPIDEVHFLAGDTNSADPLLQDEEINLLLALYPKPLDRPAYLAAAAACDAIAAKFARKMNGAVGPLSNQAEQQYLHYVQMAQQYRTAYVTKGLGTVGLSPTARVVPGVPVLGGGGPTVLGPNTLPYGGGQ